jgi:hypothetical protein
MEAILIRPFCMGYIYESVSPEEAVSKSKNPHLASPYFFVNPILKIKMALFALHSGGLSVGL